MPLKKYRFVIEKDLPEDLLPDVALELMSETIQQALGSMTIEDFEIVKPLTEEDIMDLLLKHGNLLTCFNCGKTLTEVEGERRYKHGNDRFIAGFFMDPGESRYPREPDIPASVYFICAECDEISKKKEAT
jgi:hypothetical protein